MLRGAIDVRVDARVIERPGQDRQPGRGYPAAADRPMVIASCPGGEAPDDQPDDENRRSDVHLDLPGIICIKYEQTANRDAGFTFPGIWEEAYPYKAIPDPLRALPVHFPGIWKLPVIR
jgi:hypothetical protein